MRLWGPRSLETSLWGSGDTVQSEVVNQNESGDLGNTNTNIDLPNTTALASLIKTQDLLLPRLDNRENSRMSVSACDAYTCVLLCYS